jgi:chloramphenicol-sensitive protein RarD
MQMQRPENVHVAMSDSAPSTAATRRSTAPLQPTTPLSTRGLAAGTAAFLIWGLFPLYLVGLASVSALQITAHRVAWSCLFVLLMLAARRELGALHSAAMRPGVLLRLVATAVLVSINWLAFVWGANEGHVVEVSLGYYINPLVNVLLGIFVLSERLNRMQWAAVALAAAGVAYLTFETGRLPWIALTLAISFGFYGLIRKVATVDALPGLAIEMLILLPFAVGYLVWCEVTGGGAFGHASGLVHTLLIASGVVTAVPLFLFSYGARQLPYSTMGILQYIGPSLQLACAVFLLGEPFERAKAMGFSLIWMALLVYATDGVWRARQQRVATALGT